MQYLILLLFALFFTTGTFLIAAYFLKLPTLRTARTVINMGKKKKEQAKEKDALILELAVKLSAWIPLGEYKKRKLQAVLKSAEIAMTPELYVAQSYVKAGIIFAGVIPALLIAPILSPVFVIIGIAVYFKESTRADKLVEERRNKIDYELPRFVATLTQELKASRDVLNILEIYQKQAGFAMKKELTITTADMRTGNYEAALTRLAGRVFSAMLSDVVRGLVGVVRGDDGVAYFRMLAHDMKQLEIQRLKRLAMERPPKIRRFSFLLLGCMLLLYMGVMGYQIIGTMSGMF